ncbi:TIGR00730 family Rossman fold protein [Plebeiibacterium marinum]|uniref:Cytokinin riboside 5'-monophosphate phosphoribohydrolase n=1 Tax=Plebeiibacterium marinum TaxID=2992111 RepID=A0AAE3SKE0_9BACT|nr:TIGR00730 family Rossman fold protein [Plebeiobacterium marinum]MCW3806735.1 TIGR00730 family Rossman fold protein [Plebeiobacterium marinum]
MEEIKRVCVFCASSSKVKECYTKDAVLLGKILAQKGIGMNYGGGAVGLMGAIADSMLLNRGDVTGIIPRFMVEVEWEHKGVANMIHVDTMAERKKLLVENTDAVICLPGSTGTLEELFEVLSNKKLGLFTKPVILLNTNGFFNPMIQMLDKIANEEFMRDEHRNIWSVVEKPEDVIPAIINATPWTMEAFKIAAV